MAEQRQIKIRAILRKIAGHINIHCTLNLTVYTKPSGQVKCRAGCCALAIKNTIRFYLKSS